MKRIFIIPIIALFLITFSGCSAISPTADTIEGKYVISHEPLSTESYRYIQELYFFKDGGMCYLDNSGSTIFFQYSYSKKTGTIGIYNELKGAGYLYEISDDLKTITIENYDYVLQE